MTQRGRILEKKMTKKYDVKEKRWKKRHYIRGLLFEWPLIGFYKVENIKSKTLFISIKDALIRMGIPLTDCWSQCYNGLSKTVGAKTGIATHLNKIWPRAF